MTVPWTRNSDYILKVEPTGFAAAQLGHVTQADCHMKGDLESRITEARVGSGNNPFHGLAEFSYKKFISLSR